MQHHEPTARTFVPPTAAAMLTAVFLVCLASLGPTEAAGAQDAPLPPSS